MATFTDCADNLTCATLSGSNGIGVALAIGSPNKIVVSASNVPNSALANSSININGTTIALGASGSISVGVGTVTSVTAGTNLSASGTSTDPVLNLTGNITSGLSSITGLTNFSSTTVTGTNISATDINTSTLTGSVSGSSGRFTNLTASHISSNTLTGSVSGASGQFVTLTGSSIFSNTVTGSVSGTNGQFGAATINTLNSTNIIATRVSGAFSGSGALINNLTASHINHFQEDVRSQFTAGSGINILLGQISVTNVPNSSLANSGSTIGSTAVVLGTTVPSLTGLTNFSSTTITGTTGITSSLGTFTTLTASNGLINGNLSIGTSSPTERFTVSSGSSDRIGIDVQSVTSSIYFGSNTTGAGRLLEFDRSNGLFKFKGKPDSGAFSDQLTININGNVGIGTTSPAETLDVNGTSIFRNTATFASLSASNGKILTSLSASQITASSISSSNYVGLSATTPVQYSNNVISLDGTAFTSSVGGAVAVATPLTKSGTTVGIQEASNTLVGVVNTGAQTFAGIKTFNNVITASGGITGSSTAQFTTISGSNISGTNNLIIGGNIGVGTTNPVYKLDVNGTGRFTSNVQITGTLSSSGPIYAPGLELSNSVGYSTIEMGGPNGAYIDLKKPYSDDYDIRLITDSNIESGGYLLGKGGAILSLSGSNVGIGTYSPQVSLDISSSAASVRVKETNVDARISALGGAGNVGIVGTYSNHGLVMYTNATEKVRIDTAGNVGIGTTNPATTLDVNGQQTIRGSRLYHSSSNYQTEFGPSAGTGKTDWYGIYAPSGKGIALFSNAGGERVYISSSNVGIGTENPSEKLEINSSGHAAIAITSNNNSASIYVDGNDSGTGQLTIKTDNNSIGTNPLIITNTSTEDGIAFGKSSDGNSLLFADGTRQHSGVSYGSFMIDDYARKAPNRTYFSASSGLTKTILSTRISTDTYKTSSLSIYAFEAYVPFSFYATESPSASTPIFTVTITGSNTTENGTFSVLDTTCAGLIYNNYTDGGGLNIATAISASNYTIPFVGASCAASTTIHTNIKVLHMVGSMTINNFSGELYVKLAASSTAAANVKMIFYPGAWIKVNRVDGLDLHVVDGKDL